MLDPPSNTQDTLLVNIRVYPHRTGRRGNSQMKIKGAGMLVVSLRDVHFRFCSHFGCPGQNSMIFSPYVAGKVSSRVAHEKINTYLMCYEYGLLFGSQKSPMGHAQSGLLWGCNPKLPITYEHPLPHPKPQLLPTVDC